MTTYAELKNRLSTEEFDARVSGFVAAIEAAVDDKEPLRRNGPKFGELMDEKVVPPVSLMHDDGLSPTERLHHVRSFELNCNWLYVDCLRKTARRQGVDLPADAMRYEAFLRVAAGRPPTR